LHPILFTIGEIDIRTYGVAMAMAFIVNIYIMGRRSLKDGLDPDLALNTCFWIIIGTLLGGRILFIITQWDKYVDDPISMLKLWKGGLVFYGGFLGSFLAAVLYVKVWSKKKALPITDLFSPYVGLGLAIHRNFGCFLNGCCFGRPTDLQCTIPGLDTTIHLGANFAANHPGSKLYGVNAFLHPTQVYEAINGLIIFYALLWWRGKRKNHGELTALLLCIYAVNRFIIEYFRGDPVRGMVGPFTTSQFIGFLVFAAGIAVFLYSRKYGMKAGEEERGTPSSPFYR